MDDKPKKPKRGEHPNIVKGREATQFKKGHPPMGGRPKGSLDYKSRFLKYMQLEVPTTLPGGVKEQLPILDNIILATLAKASKGDTKAATFAFERTFGKEADKVEVTGKDGDPLEFKHSGRLSEIESRLADAFGAGQGLSIPPSTED